MEEQDEYKYWAFISYSSRDRKWGEWLRKRLEGYGLPKDLVGLELADGTKLPKNLRPIFRDRDELTGSSSLGPAIEKALVESRFLIVLCSPNSAQSEWVDKEIATFMGMGREGNVLALILEGEPNSGDVVTECFPPSMRYPVEPLAGDLRREGDGKERGFLKVLAGVAELNFDDLYRRHERAARRRRLLAGVSAVVAVTVLAGLALFAFAQKGLAEKNALDAQEARVQAEGQEKIARGRLAASFAEQGRQAYLRDDGVRAAAFLNEARKVDADAPGLEWMLADLWQAQSGEVVRVRGEREAVEGLVFPETGDELLWEDVRGSVRGISLKGRKLRQMSDPVWSHPHEQENVISANGNRFAAFRQRTNPEKPDYLLRELVVEDIATEETFRVEWPRDLRGPSLFVLSPDGERLMTAANVVGEVDLVHLWKVGAKELVVVKLEEGEIAENSQWEFSANGKYLVQVRIDPIGKALVVRDAGSGELLATGELAGDTDLSKEDSVAVGGEYVVIGFRDGALAAYALGGETVVPDGPANPEEAGNDYVVGDTLTVCVSEDGELVLHVGVYGRALLYRRDGWEVLWRWGREDTGGSCRGGVISRDGKQVAVACDTGVLLYDVETGKAEKTGSFGGDGHLALAFSPDGKLLAAGMEDGDVVVREVGGAGDGLLRCKPDGVGSFGSLLEMEDGVFLAQRYKPHFYEPRVGKVSEAGEEYHQMTAISSDGKLFERSSLGGQLSVLPKGGGDGIETDWNLNSVNIFLESEAKLAGVMVDNTGLFRLYDAKPAFLGKGVKCEDAAGQVTALLREDGGDRICAAFANGAFVITAVEGKGLAPFLVKKPEGVEEKLPVLMQFMDGVLLYESGGGIFLFDVDADVNTEIPVAECQAARLAADDESLLVLTVNVFGQVECWDTEGRLVFSGRPLADAMGEKTILGGDKKGGPEILMDAGGDEILTSYGDRVFMWSFPELKFLWKSVDAKIPSMSGDRIVLRKYDEEVARVVFSDIGVVGDDTFREIVSLPVPGNAPGVAEMEKYLEDVAAVKMAEGQVVPVIGGE